MFERRPKIQAPWTNFESSPFFGKGSRSNTSKRKGNFVKRWPSMKEQLDTITFQPETPSKVSHFAKSNRSKSGSKSGKSVTTATTASMSHSSTGNGGRLHSPGLSEDIKLPIGGSRVSNGKTSQAPPILDMNTKVEQSSRRTFQPVKNIRQLSRHYTLDKLKRDLEEDTIETEFSDEEREIREDPQGILRDDDYHNPGDPHCDPGCMPVAMDDFREIASSTMTKALLFFNQVSSFCSDKVDRAKERRKRNSAQNSKRPTSVHIMPRSSNSPAWVAFDSAPSDESRPPAMVEDFSDDLSSLTEPPFFLLQKTQPTESVTPPPEPTSYFPNRPASRRQKQGNVHAQINDLGDEFIEFEAANSPTRITTSKRNSGDGPPISRHSNEQSQACTPETCEQPSGLSSMHKHDAVLRNGDWKPILGDKLSDISSDNSPGVDKVRFPFTKFIPRPRKEPSRKQQYPRQRRQIQVEWEKEVPKPGFVRESLQKLRAPRRRTQKSDLESVSC